MRKASITRKTNETDIKLELCLEGGPVKISTGCGFLDHMLNLFAAHGGFSLIIDAKGDAEVDYHHTVEDLGIVLGEAFLSAIGEAKGIMRYACIHLPMDEALIMSALDISGRSHLSYNVAIDCAKVGEFDTELVKEFLLGFVRSFKITLHISKLAGENAHHIIEAVFKSLARALKTAVAIDYNNESAIPSTKGRLY